MLLDTCVKSRMECTCYHLNIRVYSITGHQLFIVIQIPQEETRFVSNTPTCTCIIGEVTDYDQSHHFLIHRKISPQIFRSVSCPSLQVYFALNFWKNNTTIHYYTFFPFSPNFDNLILSFPPWTNNCLPSQMCHTHKPRPVTHIIQSGGFRHDLTIYI